MYALTCALAHLPRPLIDEAQQAGLRLCADAWPGPAINFFGFETVLGTEAATVDFACNLTADGLRYVAHAPSASPPIPAALARLAQDWAAAGQHPDRERAAGNFWLEYDTSQPTPLDPSAPPSVFVALDNPADWRTRYRQDWLSNVLLPGRIAEAQRRPIGQLLSRCLAALPPGVQKIQVGMMLARPLPAVRLCAFNLTAADVLPYLAAVGWNGPEAAVSALLDQYAPLADSLCLHLDIGSSLFPTLGLELIYEAAHPRHWQPAVNPRWAQLLGRLTAAGLCEPAKMAALLDFPAQVPVTLPLIERLIAAVQSQQNPMADVPQEGILTLGLQHVKLKLDGAGQLTAKAYFGGQLDPDNLSETMAAHAAPETFALQTATR